MDEFLRKLRRALADRIVEVRLFGSKATGRDTPDSDIDVVVLVNEATVEVEDQVLEIAFQVNLAHEVYISPRVLTPAILSHPVWKLTPFVQAVVNEGIPL